MNIEKKGSQFIITIPDSVGMEGVQQLIDYLIYKQVTTGSQATQEQVDELAKEVNKDWWERNKSRFLRP